MDGPEMAPPSPSWHIPWQPSVPRRTCSMMSRSVQWLRMCPWSWHLKESPTTAAGRRSRSTCTGRRTHGHPGYQGSLSGQGQGFGKASPEPRLGAGVGVVTDRDEPQDARELSLHGLVLDGDQSLLMGACMPRGAELAPGPHPTVREGPVPRPGINNSSPSTKNPWYTPTPTKGTQMCRVPRYGTHSPG